MILEPSISDSTTSPISIPYDNTDHPLSGTSSRTSVFVLTTLSELQLE
jgi:hypothetical protein